MGFTITAASWNFMRYNFFSNLPYAVLNIQTNLKISNCKSKLKLYKFRWRNTIVTLRAPKHFKVGRQHYSQGTRLVSLRLFNQSIIWIKNVKSFSELATNLSTFIHQNAAAYPLSNLKTATSKITVKLIVNSVK